MKIKVAELSTFVEKATLNGLIPSAILNIKDKRLSCKVRDLGNALVIESFSSINTDEELSLCIKDTKILLSVLKIFDGEIELRKTDNVLSFVNKDRQVDIILTKEEFVENNLTKDLPLDWDNPIDTPTTILKNSVRNMNIISSKTVEMQVVDKVLTLTTGENNFDKITEKMSIEHDDCKVTYGEHFANVVNTLGDKVTLSFKSDFPCKITEKTKDAEFVYVVAPIVEND